MSNERLLAALLTLDLSPADLASRVDVDPKTVERWITVGRTPHPRIATRVARLLNVETTYLWPEVGARRVRQVSPTDEFIACYPGRSAVPATLAADLVDHAMRRVDLVGNPATYGPGLLDRATARHADGVAVRVVLPYGGPLTDVAGLIVTRAAEPLMTAVLRADDEILIRTNVDGVPPAFAPVLHLHRLDGGPLAALYLAGLDCIHETAASATPTLRAVA